MKKIILLIPHFNNPVGLKSSILSINEDIPLDILIVDDGSNDKIDLADLQSNYLCGAIEIEYLSKNQGIEKALNTGLAIIKSKNYKYVGRLDCGDFCKKDKFSKQISYLEENNQIALLGSWANVIDEDGNFMYDLKHPTSYDQIKKQIYINSTFVHPTVVFNTTLLDKIGYYPENYKYAEDYAYFIRIAKNFRVENYPEVLLDYVVSAESISSKKRKQQVLSRIRIIYDNFYFGFHPVYGLLRNSILYFVSRANSDKIKKIILYIKTRS